MMTPQATDSMFGQSTAPAGKELDLRDLALTIWRYKLLIVSIVVVTTGLSYLYINSLTPRYRAEASLVLDIRRANVGIDPVIAEQRPNEGVIRSEVDVLRSRWLTRRVVQRLNLADDSEFNPRLRQPGLTPTEWIGESVRRLRTQLAAFDALPPELRERLALAPAPAEAETPAPAAAQTSPTAVIEAVLGRLSVISDGRSYTVDLYFESEDPEKAARIVNTFAELYLGGQVESKYDAAERGAGWLEKKIEQLRERVRAADTAVLEYRRNNALLGWGDDNVLKKRLDQFGSELVAAQSQRVRAETRLREMRELSASPLSAASGPALTQWKELDDLLEKLRAIEVKLTSLRSVYGENHPLILATRAERDRQNDQVRQEVARIIASLESDARLARAQEAAFKAKLSELEAQNVEAHRDELELRQLESAANAARSLYDTFVASLDRTSVQLDLVQPDARVLSRAEPPPWPSYPQRKILLAVTVVAAIGLSIAIAFVLDFMHHGFRAADQVERALGAPVIGMIPLVKDRGRGLRHPSSYALRNPYSAFTESVRLIRSAIDLSNLGPLGRVVLVTSAVPDEGKTALALTMGRLAAMSGQKPLLIDCDLRSPSVSADLGAGPSRGLAEFLIGQASIKEVLRIDETSGLCYISAGRPSVRAIALLTSGRMAKLIRAAGHVSNLIILDSPPVGLVSDPLELSRLADTTLVVVRWDRTPRVLVSAAMKRLRAAGAKTAVVLSQVNLARHASYGFGDFAHGYFKGYLSD